MISRALSRTFACLLLLAVSASAQRIADTQLHTLVSKGIQFAGEQRYAEARVVFDEAIRSAPSHPAGYINKAILLEVMSLDFETPVPQPEFNTLLEKTIALGERMIEKPEQAAEGNYYTGMANSYIAYYKFRDGEDWLSGLTHGMKANGYLKDCLDANPKAWDAMTGVGTYKYWKSRRMSFLTWTPFVDDERFAGINYLRLAAARAEYTEAQAVNALIWIYIEEERYGDAISAAQRMLKLFPRNRLFLWGLASAAEKRGNLQLAREAYTRIVQSIDADVLERRYIEVQARGKIARLSFQMGDRVTAKRECDWVLANGRFDRSGFTPDGAARIKRRLEDMTELRKELSH